MIHINTIELLGLKQYKDVIESVNAIINDSQIDAWIILSNNHNQKCPNCGFKSIMNIKERPNVNVLHISDKFKPVYLHVKNIRLICPNCKKTFTPILPFVFSDFPKLSSTLVLSIMDELRNTDHSFSEIAKKHWVSDKTVARIFEARVSYKIGIPTSYMCIDEKCYIHGNTKFCMPILDFETNRLIDICKDRHKSTLKEWLRYARDHYIKPPANKSMDTSLAIAKEYNRTIELKCICIDMSQYFYDAIHDIFPYVPIAVDSPISGLDPNITSTGSCDF